MSDTQSFNYILTFMMLIVAGLALPYIGKNRQDLLGVTSIYRPLSLAFLFIHFGFLLAVSLFKWENSLWSPTTLLLSNIFIALEVRSVRTLRKRHIPPNCLALGTIGAAFFAFLMFQFSQPGTRVSIYSIGAMVNALWVMTELRKIKSYFPTYIYGLLTVSGYTLTFLLVVRYAVAVASGHFIVGQLQSPSYLVMTVAFLAYGCLFLFLLALNHGYTLSLWRAAAFQRRSAELSLLNVLRGILDGRTVMSEHSQPIL
jgi:hypothetical protein